MEQNSNLWILLKHGDARICDKIQDCKNGLDDWQAANCPKGEIVFWKNKHACIGEEGTGDKTRIVDGHITVKKGMTSWPPEYKAFFCNTSCSAS